MPGTSCLDGKLSLGRIVEAFSFVDSGRTLDGCKKFLPMYVV